jgi:peptidoglycan/xylan/chitin deacetylase (PgdA/CDA1 family)
VSPDWPARLSVPPQRLAAQLDHLANLGYRGVTFSDAVGGGEEGKVVAITFDDGYRSVFELARPILERLGWPGTLFVPTDFVDRDEPMAWPGIDQWVGGNHEHELMPITWEQAHSLIAAGWEIGSHTKSHPRLTDIPGDEVAEQLAGSKHVLEEKLGRRCRSVAFPYGNYDDSVVAATEVAGYSAAATLPEGNPDPSPLSWPRIGVYFHDGPLTFRLKVAPMVLRLRRSRIWSPLMRMRRKLTGRELEA